jgi:hypothetical protein
MSEQDEEVLETTSSNGEENSDQEIDNDTDDVEALREALEREKIAKQQILARAKKAEALLKENKEKPSLNNNVLTSDDVETKILKAQGLPDDEINYLKKLAKLNDTSIIEAQSDEIFKSFKANKEAQEKSEKAKLGASRGSGTVKKEKTFTTKRSD